VQNDESKPNVLFLCTGNSCRSQMAEGWARHLHSQSLAAYSAGVKPTVLNPDAVRVMAEAGVDISRHHSKHIDDLAHVAFDCVVTVCDDAHESCPVFPGHAKVIHRGFDDPPRLAQGAETEADRLAPYRRVRDEIREFVQSLPELLASEAP
jgi:arsenate reductase (thioredoxin)